MLISPVPTADQVGRSTGRSQLPVSIDRGASITLHPFLKHFKGFEKIGAVRAIFGSKTEEVLGKLKVEFFSSRFWYMGVSDEDGSMLVSTHHLKGADLKILYLDVIHELHHVKQFQDGRPLFDPKYEYPDNPTEVEAYKYTVAEAIRIGMPEAEIVEYLKVEWMTPAQHKRLARRMGLGRSEKNRSSS